MASRWITAPMGSTLTVIATGPTRAYFYSSSVNSIFTINASPTCSLGAESTVMAAAPNYIPLVSGDIFTLTPGSSAVLIFFNEGEY